jgi:hypothetical protein
LSNSIISGNQSASGPPDVYGNPYITYANDYIGGNAMLAPLADNGGPTLTHLPMAGSPVIDAGDPGVMGGTDQRGFERVVEMQMDIGSVEFGATGSPSCDFDDSGACDIDDIDALVAQIAAGTNDPAFDLTGDGLVNLDDRDEWLALAGEMNIGPGKVYLLGDANLDTVVDGLDFIEWNNNKFTNVAAWSAADFNADGVVDGLDFIIWNDNKFQSSDSQGALSSDGDRLLGRSLRPENALGKMGHADDNAARSGREFIQSVQPINRAGNRIGNRVLMGPVVSSQVAVTRGVENQAAAVVAGVAVDGAVPKLNQSALSRLQSSSFAVDRGRSPGAQSAFHAESAFHAQSAFHAAAADLPEVVALDRIMAEEFGGI